MAGTIVDRKLKEPRADRVRFALATQADDPEIRGLLRANPMAGRIGITFECEPDSFADTHWPGTEKQTIVAYEAGQAICIGSCVVRDRFVNGQPQRVGYLGGLRLDARAAGRFEILRRGYEFFHELQKEKPADFYFTSIASDNAPARTLLERGLRGMPSYEFVGEYVTVLIALPGRTARHCDAQESLPDRNDIVAYLNKHGRDYQFAACWSQDELTALSSLGLPLENFRITRDGESVGACAALWDQRCFKQTVIRSYAPWLATARPAVNFFAGIIGRPALPAVGSKLAHAFVSPLAVGTDQPGALTALLNNMELQPIGKGIKMLTLGFASNDPRLLQLRKKFRCHEFRSRIYVVRWPELGRSAKELDGRCIGPEVALL